MSEFEDRIKEFFKGKVFESDLISEFARKFENTNKSPEKVASELDLDSDNPAVESYRNSELKIFRSYFKKLSENLSAEEQDEFKDLLDDLTEDHNMETAIRASYHLSEDRFKQFSKVQSSNVDEATKDIATSALLASENSKFLPAFEEDLKIYHIKDVNAILELRLKLSEDTREATMARLDDKDITISESYRNRKLRSNAKRREAYSDLGEAIANDGRYAGYEHYGSIDPLKGRLLYLQDEGVIELPERFIYRHLKDESGFVEKPFSIEGLEELRGLIPIDNEELHGYIDVKMRLAKEREVRDSTKLRFAEENHTRSYDKEEPSDKAYEVEAELQKKIKDAYSEELSKFTSEIYGLPASKVARFIHEQKLDDEYKKYLTNELISSQSEEHKYYLDALKTNLELEEKGKGSRTFGEKFVSAITFGIYKPKLKPSYLSKSLKKSVEPKLKKQSELKDSVTQEYIKSLPRGVELFNEHEQHDEKARSTTRLKEVEKKVAKHRESHELKSALKKSASTPSAGAGRSGSRGVSF